MDNILFWNCAGGIKSKIDYLREFVKGKYLKIIFISEADLKEQDLDLVKIPGFDIILSNTCKGEFKKSRMIGYVRSNETYKSVTILTNQLDVVAIDIKSNWKLKSKSIQGPG